MQNFSKIPLLEYLPHIRKSVSLAINAFLVWGILMIFLGFGGAPLPIMIAITPLTLVIYLVLLTLLIIKTVRSEPYKSKKMIIFSMILPPGLFLFLLLVIGLLGLVFGKTDSSDI